MQIEETVFYILPLTTYEKQQKYILSMHVQHIVCPWQNKESRVNFNKNDYKMAQEDILLAEELESTLASASPVELAESRARFTEKCCEKYKLNVDDDESKPIYKKSAITKKQIEYVIKVLEEKSPRDGPKGYHYLKNHYCVRTVGEYKQLFENESKKKNKSEHGRLFVPLDDLFDVCMKLHKDCGSQGRKVMEPMAAKKFANGKSKNEQSRKFKNEQYYSGFLVGRWPIELLLSFSHEYQLKRKKVKIFGRCIKPIQSTQFNSRMQIDLIDFRTLPDGDFQWILNCQDHLTKFCWLVPLKQKCADEV